MDTVTLKVPKPISAIINYLKYPSTWKGIIGFLTIIGVTIKPELQMQLITAGSGIVAGIAVFFSDADVVTPPAA